MAENRQRRYPSSVLIALVGPLVGAMVFVGSMYVEELIAGRSVAADELLLVLAMFLVIGWLFGIAPATIAALIWHVWCRRLRGPARFVTALAIGGAIGAVFGLPFAQWPDDRGPAGIVLTFTAMGAIAMVVTAVPFGAREP